MARAIKPTDEDVGAAMMAWYANAIKEFPDGLVSQAQAAQMLGVSRVAVSRLITRGYLEAIYFPKPPDIEGLTVGQDDPTWLKICGWLGEWDAYVFPKACYVSFADVVMLWQSGEAKKRCKKDWSEMVADLFSDTNLKRYADHRARRLTYRVEAEEFRENMRKANKKENEQRSR
jgi:predicted DNA-binding transcriptional regulator AlpA